MPRPIKDLDQYQDEIEHQISIGNSQTQILTWLAAKNIGISRNTLSRRLNEWNVNRYSQTASVNATLVSAVKEVFHTTDQNNDTIAQNIINQGISTSSRQVKKVRLEHDWQRRAYNDDQLAQNRVTTLELVKQALQHGECRCYGRGLMRTYLRVKFQHNA